jgi:hypothetical protein
VKLRTLNLLRSAAQTVGGLVEECRKGGPLYQDSPKLVAHVSRTSKWLLNALAALQQELATPRAKPNQQSS